MTCPKSRSLLYCGQTQKGAGMGNRVSIFLAIWVCAIACSSTAADRIFGQVDIDFTWSFSGAPESNTWETGDCFDTNVRIADTSGASRVRFLSCPLEDSPNSDCSISSTLGPSVLGGFDNITHSDQFLRAESRVAPTSGVATVTATCTRQGLLAAEDSGALISQLGVEVTAGVSDLSTQATASVVTIANSGGDDAIIPSASPTNAGVMTSQDFSKLATVEESAERNLTSEEFSDAHLASFPEVTSQEIVDADSIQIRSFSPRSILEFIIEHAQSSGSPSVNSIGDILEQVNAALFGGEYIVANYESDSVTFGEALALAINDCKNSFSGSGEVILPGDGIMRTLLEEERALLPTLGACDVKGSGWRVKTGYPQAFGASVIQLSGPGFTPGTGPVFTVDVAGTRLKGFAILSYLPTGGRLIQLGDGLEPPDTAGERTGLLSEVAIEDVYLREYSGTDTFPEFPVNRPADGRSTGLFIDDVLKSTVTNVLVEGFATNIHGRGVTAAFSFLNVSSRESTGCGLEIDGRTPFRILKLRGHVSEANFKGLCVEPLASGFISDFQGYYENGSQFRVGQEVIEDRANVFIESSSASYTADDTRYTGNANIATGRDFVATAGLDDDIGGVSQASHRMNNVRMNNGTTVTGPGNRLQITNLSRTAVDATFLPYASVYGGTHTRVPSDCAEHYSRHSNVFLDDTCTETDTGFSFVVSAVDVASGRGLAGTVTLERTNEPGGGSAPLATTSVAGLIEIATAGQTNGTGINLAVTPFGLNAWDGSLNLSEMAPNAIQSIEIQDGEVTRDDLDPAMFGSTDGVVMTGTPGTNGNCAEWSNGTLVDSGNPCASSAGGAPAGGFDNDVAGSVYINGGAIVADSFTSRAGPDGANGVGLDSNLSGLYTSSVPAGGAALFTKADGYIYKKDGTDPDEGLALSTILGAGFVTLGTAPIGPSPACAPIVTVPVPGAGATNMSQLSPLARLSGTAGFEPLSSGGLKVYHWLTAGALNVEVCNPTASAITPGATALNYRVTQ